MEKPKVREIVVLSANEGETDSLHRRRLGCSTSRAGREKMTREEKVTSRGPALLFGCLTAIYFGCGKSLGSQSAVMHHVSGSLIALSTPDSSAAAHWYQDKLGFQLVKEGRMGKDLRFALLRYDDNILELIQNPEARPLAKAVPGIKDPFEIYGIFKTGFTVHNLDDVFNQLKQGGVKIDFNITQLNDLGLRAFGVRDVDGNLIQFFGR
jgi:catechol 2,3-dioxygenase-like lactoylglutathione lyase family enzyme